jgi:nucleoside-diphosphate-sugar epimerase
VNLSKRTVAITGATGFLGGHLIDALLARGAHVVAVVRNPQKAAPLSARGVEIREAELHDHAALVRAFTGVDAAVHAAAQIAFSDPRGTMRTNAEGTRSVFRALAQAGVKRAVHVSSALAHPFSLRAISEKNALRRGDEHAWLHAYGESKARAEHLARAISGESGIALTTLRPCGITGPDDPNLIPALRAATRFPVAVLPAFTTIGVVHAGDVAEAVCAALERDASAGQSYVIQGHTVSLWKLARRWAELAGAPTRLFIPVPLPFALRFDDRLARRELGFSPRSIDAIFAEAAAR